MVDKKWSALNEGCKDKAFPGNLTRVKTRGKARRLRALGSSDEETYLKMSNFRKQHYSCCMGLDECSKVPLAEFDQIGLEAPGRTATGAAGASCDLGYVVTDNDLMVPAVEPGTDGVSWVDAVE
jgi:hypothetical protein